MHGRNTRALAVAIALLALSGCDYFVDATTRLERARAHIQEGNRRAALVELKNALQKEPELHNARVLLADVALWLGDAASADAEMQRLPPDVQIPDADDVRVRIDLALKRREQVLERIAQPNARIEPARRDLYRGLALLQEHRTSPEAERAFRDAIAKDPSMTSAHAGLIEALLAQREMDRALETSDKLIDMYPQSAEVWLARARATAGNDPKAALAALERARDLAPQQLDSARNVLLLSALAEQQLAAGDRAGARATSDRLAQLAPGSPIAVLISSRIAMASNDYIAATTELRRLVNATPRMPYARFLLGAALTAQGALEQASQELSQVVEQAPEFIEARQLLAQVRIRLEDPDGALRVLAPGLDSDAVDARFLSLVDLARSEAGASSEAVELLEQAAARNPRNRGAALQLSAAYLQSGAPQKAVARLRAMDRDPLDPRQEALLLQAILEVEGLQPAISAATALVAEHPGDARIVSLAAAFHARLGDAAAARDIILTALGSDRTNPELLMTLARIEWGANERAEAMRVLRQLLGSQPGYAPARLALAEAQLASGNPSAARAELEALRKADPRALAPRLMLARMALVDQNASEADAVIAEALATGDVGRVNLAAGVMYLNAGRYDQAVQHLRAALEADASAAPVWVYLGRAHLALNQQAPAREAFERALVLRPHWVAAEGALAFLDLQSGANEAALQRAFRLRAARPRDPAAATLEAQLQFALRRYAEAARAFDDAIAMRPSAALAIGAYQARSAVKRADATGPLERWLELHPGDAAVRSVLAEGYTQAGNREQAAEQYRTIIAAHPQHAQALNNLAWLYYELKDPRAESVAQQASNAAPHSPEVSDTLGWILVENGRIDRGLPILERAAAARKADPEINYHYAAALLRSGASDAALPLLRRLLREHPSFPSRAEAERLVGSMQGA